MSASVAVVCLGTEAHPRALASLAEQGMPVSVFLAHQTRTSDVDSVEEPPSSLQMIRWKCFRPLSFAERINRLMSLVFTRWENEDLDTRWVCFLDGDATLDPHVFEEALSAMQTDLTLSVVSPVLCEEERTRDEASDAFCYTRTDRVLSAGYALSTRRVFAPMHQGASLRDLPIVPWNAFGFDGRAVMIRASTLHRALLDRETLFYPWIREAHAWFELSWRLRWMGERCLCFPRMRAWIPVVPESKRDQTFRRECVRSVRALHDPIALRFWTLPSLVVRAGLGFGTVIRHPSIISYWMRSWYDVFPRFRHRKTLRSIHRVSTRLARGWFSEPVAR